MLEAQQAENQAEDILGVPGVLDLEVLTVHDHAVQEPEARDRRANDRTPGEGLHAVQVLVVLVQTDRVVFVPQKSAGELHHLRARVRDR